MSREFRVTTERLVEADTAAEAAALSARIPPDEWVVYSDDYRVVTVVTPQEVTDVHAGWEADIVEADIVEDKGLGLEVGVEIVDEVQNMWPDLVRVDTYLFGRTFSSGEVFTVDIDPGEFT